MGNRSEEWAAAYKAVIVGWDSATRQVQYIHVRNDGGMETIEPPHLHFPIESSAEHEAVTVFNLSGIRTFAEGDEQSAYRYAEQLRRDRA